MLRHLRIGNHTQSSLAVAFVSIRRAPVFFFFHFALSLKPTHSESVTFIVLEQSFLSTGGIRVAKTKITVVKNGSRLTSGRDSSSFSQEYIYVYMASESLPTALGSQRDEHTLAC